MNKPRIRYGILDEFGDVIRWQWSKPTAAYQFVTQRIAPVDLSGIEDALF